MQRRSAHILNMLTRAFYRDNAESFAQTRSMPWKGFETLAAAIERGEGLRGTVHLVDLACGNLRFERFLAARHPEVLFEVSAFDSTPELAAGAALPENVHVRIEQLDAIALLLEEGTCAASLPDGSCDMAVAFGFLHHVPGFEQRCQLLDDLLATLAPGGFLAVSLWQFMDDARLAAKAHATTEEALQRYPELRLEDGDYLLGWQNETEAYRYCHHFTEDESQVLSAHLHGRAALLSEFTADGKRGDLNRYLVWQRI